jgi:hypothetical protein
MTAEISNRRSDGQLGLILYETANWMVAGPQGMVLGEVASLRIAIEMAEDFTAVGREVVALVRGRPTEIVVFSGQAWKLTDGLSEPEVAPILHAMNA